MKQSKLVSSLLANWVPKVFSFLIALFIVVTVRFLNVNDRVVKLPLNVSLPEEYTAASLVPSTVDVVITGDDNIIYLVDPEQITAYADFSAVSGPGITRVPITLVYDGDIFSDDGLTVSARPSSVRILFEEKGE